MSTVESSLKAPLISMDVSSRIPKLQSALADKGIDALLVTSLTNIRYLTGFTGSTAMLLVNADDSLFVTDGRYKFQCVEQLEAADVKSAIVVGGGKEQKEALTMKASSAKKLGVEGAHLSWSLQQKFASQWFEAELIPTEGMVEELRKVKDTGEVARIERAAHIADEALEQTKSLLLDGITEEEFGFALDTEIRRLTKEGTSFETIVASGPNGAKAHHQPSDRRIGHGELIVIDFGAKVDGYCSDMTRTLCVREPADPTMQKMYDVVFESQQTGVEAVRPGLTGEEIDATCREVIEKAGWGDAFMHSTGHGVGLDIHEEPYIAKEQSGTLVENYVITVEPGVYLEQWGGVRIEDTAVVTADGCRILTQSPKTLII